VHHLHLAVGVRVNGTSVDHSRGVAVTGPLKLLDPPVEARVGEPDHDELYRPDGHRALLVDEIDGWETWPPDPAAQYCPRRLERRFTGSFLREDGWRIRELHTTRYGAAVRTSSRHR
jgi:hypothetical protein